MNDADDRRAVLAEVNEQLLLNMIEAQSAMEAQARALQEVRRHAEIDPLTQLPNRVLLFDRCARAIASAHRHHGRLAILFVDIDDFKAINDRGGHATGDRALQGAARRLLSGVRAVDTVSRFGGDEFVILISEIATPSDTALIAAKIIAALATPDSEAPGLGVSIGVGIYPDDGLDAEVLIKRADAAMYLAKQAGGRTWRQWGDNASRASSRVETFGIASAPAAREARSDRGTLPTLRRIVDGPYRFDLRTYGYEGSGWVTKSGPQFASGGGICRFWGSVSESGGHATASVTVRIDDPEVASPIIDRFFTMQMAGAIADGGFSLLGIGPRGVIIEIDCTGPASEGLVRSDSRGVADEGRM